jgi:hypothetical protein
MSYVGRFDQCGTEYEDWHSQVVCIPTYTPAHHSRKVQNPEDCTLEAFTLSRSLWPGFPCKLQQAINDIPILTRNPGCQFLATNEDNTFLLSTDASPAWRWSFQCAVTFCAGEGSSKYREAREDDAGLYSSQLSTGLVSDVFR